MGKHWKDELKRERERGGYLITKKENKNKKLDDFIKDILEDKL